ncbi:His-Xaa-Ser system radical SAM maturase HxsC [Eubacterium ventriosum]|uniref:His-Xaa-Ser system radical SAM maturase HxsC n=1 Tax=Eubacterium ventriosum TaxID=39496 RepID=UPI003522AE52
MRIKFTNYSGKNKIISVATNEQVKKDLEADELDYIYVHEGRTYLYPDDIELVCDEKYKQVLEKLNDYDVFELWEDGTLVQCYANDTMDNYFFVTGKCKSNCIMCPSPEVTRKNSEVNEADKLIEIAKHIPIGASHLTITGGEPFMIGESIFSFFDFLKKKFLHTEFLILTNGRVFCVPKYLEDLKESIPNNTIIGIPLYGSNSIVHDKITQAKGSFEQTVYAIEKLCDAGINIELRIVVNKLNIEDFENIVNLIINKLHKVQYISIIAMEMTGNAYINRDSVWIPYTEIFKKTHISIMKLIENELDVKLYNFPLCTVDKSFWTICEKSISQNKVKYAEVCSKCAVRDACGGVFAGTYNLEKGDLKIINEA